MKKEELFNIDEYIAKKEKELFSVFNKLDNIAYKNHKKVLQAFLDNEVLESDFYASTGYGYYDSGREKLDKLYSDIFKSEDAFVRFSFLSGTHAIAITLLSIIDKNVLVVPENIYDTIKPTFLHIQEKENHAIIYDNFFNLDDTLKKIKLNNIGYIYIQKSKGYFFRRSFSNFYLKNYIFQLKKQYPDLTIIVDNCYGELVEEIEPIESGADLVIGSLIKNLGGGIAPSGAYIVGRKDLIDKIIYYYHSPSLEKEMGASFGLNRYLYMGLYYSPLVVNQALKGLTLFSYILSDLGFKVLPEPFEDRYDIVQAIQIGNKDLLIEYAQFVQNFSPIDSNAILSPIRLPGYKDKIVMAAGTFYQGASLEFSADAPIRPPYVLYMQGGISYLYIKYIIKEFLLKYGGING